MDLTAREIEESSRRTARWYAAILVVARLIQPLLRLVLRIGFIRRTYETSAAGRNRAIFGLASRGEHEQAANLAIQALRYFRHRPPGRIALRGQDDWWLFMDLAAENLSRCADQERFDELIEMAKDGVEPFEGYLVARSYLAFARWKHRVKNYDAAIEFAEAAVRADETWAQADYELGWYCLVTGRDDAMQHLGRAVAKDPEIVSRIADDPIWEHRPDVLEELRKLAAEDGDAPAN